MDNRSNDGEIGRFDIRALSPEQLGQLGVSQIAYIKPVQVDGMAMVAIQKHEMMPILVH